MVTLSFILNRNYTYGTRTLLPRTTLSVLCRLSALGTSVETGSSLGPDSYLLPSMPPTSCCNGPQNICLFSRFVFFIYVFLCVYSVCVCALQQVMLGSLELPRVVSYLIWMLEMGLWFSVIVLNCSGHNFFSFKSKMITHHTCEFCLFSHLGMGVRGISPSSAWNSSA